MQYVLAGFLLSGSLYGQSLSIESLATEFQNTLRSSDLSIQSCRELLLRTRNQLASIQNLSQVAEPQNAQQVAQDFANGRFTLFDQYNRWRTEGKLTPDDGRIINVVDRIGFFTLGKLLFYERIMKPLIARGELHSFQGYQKGKMPDWMLEPVFLFSPEISEIPEIIGVVTRGDANHFAGAFISSGTEANDENDGRFSHTFIMNTRTKTAIEPLIESSTPVRTDAAHIDLVTRARKMGMLFLVAPRDQSAVAENFEHHRRRILELGGRMPYNSTMSDQDPLNPERLFCSQAYGVCMGYSASNPAFFMTRVDMGNPYSHFMLSIKRGQIAYAPKDALRDPNNFGVGIIINPLIFNEESLAAIIQDEIENLIQKNWTYHPDTMGAILIRDIAIPVNQTYFGHSLLKKYNIEIPEMDDNQATYFGAAQSVYKYIFARAKKRMIELIKKYERPLLENEERAIVREILEKELNAPAGSRLQGMLIAP